MKKQLSRVAVSRHVLLSALLLACAGANAASITMQSGTASTAGGGTSPSPLAVNYVGDGDGDATAEPGETVGFQVRINYNTAEGDATVTAQNGATCSVNDAAGQILVIANDPSGLPFGGTVATPLNFCNIVFTAVAGAARTITFDVNTGGAGDGCFDTGLAATTCTTVDGTVTVTAGPASPTLTYNPAAGGTVNLAGGGTATGNITVTAAGASGGGTTALACTAPAGFTAVVTGSPFSDTATTGNIALTCTTGPAAVNGTLNCTETPSVGAPAARTFNLVCPATAPFAEYASSPAVPGPITFQGAPGSVVTSGLTIQNIGVGVDLTYACTTASAGFAVTGGGAGTIPGGGSATVGVSCTTPAAAGSAITGTLTCTSSDTDEATNVYNLTCLAQVVSVPTMGAFGKGVLAALIAGLGLLGFALRRRFAA